MNIIFYGVFNQQFRVTAKKLFVENIRLCKKRSTKNSNDFSFRKKRKFVPNATNVTNVANAANVANIANGANVANGGNVTIGGNKPTTETAV
jgi:hypothetical protein